VTNDDAALLERLFGALRGFYRLLAGASEGAHLVELPGVQACVVPATPERSYTNAVVYDDADALEAALDDLATAYAAADVDAWTVWVPEPDRRAAELLGTAGHRLDGRPTAMGCALDGIERPPDRMRWSSGVDARVLAEINDSSFGYGTDSFARAFARLDPARFHVYAAELDGRPAGVLMTSDHDGNCDVQAVATLPHARGRGLAGDLLRHALVDARERGCETSTLIATSMGRPLYERIGFRPLGIVEMWERRR
jgi:ribosomal protein S18 acetylase RimI-like enzyme